MKMGAGMTDCVNLFMRHDTRDELTKNIANYTVKPVRISPGFYII
jgi:hypothetical protein